MSWLRVVFLTFGAGIFKVSPMQAWVNWVCLGRTKPSSLSFHVVLVVFASLSLLRTSCVNSTCVSERLTTDSSLIYTHQLLKFNHEDVTAKQRRQQQTTTFWLHINNWLSSTVVNCWPVMLSVCVWLSCQASGFVKEFSLELYNMLQVLFLGYHGGESRFLDRLLLNRNCLSFHALPQALQGIGPKR